MDHETHKSRGFAFVEMRDQGHANAAIAGMNGKELAGQLLKVNEAKPRTPRGEQGPQRSPGGYGGPSRQGGSLSGYGIRDRINSAFQGKDDDIYDSKNGRGGQGNRGRGGRGFDSGGKPGGRRSR